jgi:DNA polymerase-1
MISGHGPDSSAEAFLIADGASDSDVSAGLALTGDAERKLSSFCLSAGLAYNTLWKTALIKERINLKDPSANYELLTDQYKEILLNEINTIKPNVLVPLSEISFHYLTGLSGIRKFRGSVFPPAPNLQLFRPNVRIIPILGPNPYLYEDEKLNFISRLDFVKVARNISNAEPITEVGTVWVAKTAAAFREFVNRHYDKSKLLVFDIETFGNIPTCISFCFDGLESVCVPILDWGINIDQRMLMLQLVLRLLASPIPKGNQNVKFDLRKLHRLGWVVNNITMDTMLAQACNYAEFPKNLGFLTSLYTDMPYFKDEGKEFDPTKHNRNKLYLYNAKDSLATHQIATAQAAELVELGTKAVYDKLIEILPIYMEMEENGILVDDTRRKFLLNKYENLYEIHCYKLSKLIGREINPLSSLVVGKIVYGELGYKAVSGIKKKKSGNLSADEDSLELLIWTGECNSNLGKAILRTVIDCRKLHKVIEILRLQTYSDGRLRCDFNLAGAETGRTTSSETSDYYLMVKDKKVKLANMGHSLQTIGKHGFTVDGDEYGKDIRSIFVPSHGYSFVECDLSQAEARVDAILAEDFDILSIFDGPTGIHKLTGGWVFDCDPSEIKKNQLTLNEAGVGEDRYTTAKVVRHAAERNMGEKRLLMMLRQPIATCAKILRRVHDRQPKIRGIFHRQIREQIQQNRNLVAPNGRRRDFFGRIDEHAINEGISFLPQAIVTDYLKTSLRKTIAECRDYVRPLSEAHDGFLSEVKHGHEEHYAETFKRNVEQPIDFRSCSLSRDYRLVIPCEAAVGKDNWQELEDLKL